MRLININSSKVELDLNAVKYSIYVLGGWGVKCGRFAIEFRNVKSNESVWTQRPFLGLQTYINHKRAKKIFTIEISKKDKYRLVFHHPDSITVNRSNMFFFSTPFNPRQTGDLKIKITKDNGMFLFK